MLDPIDEAQTLSELAELGFTLKEVPRDGNCYPRGCLLSAGMLNDDEGATHAKIMRVREQSVSMVCGARVIDGVPAAE
eukprot:7142905-Prymnesium_polylepis.1